ncbi:hypothetical protein [Streptomyces sp. NPDC057681]|uniref:hypothetical protein n=1 Tax=unclassified Streptomyces TaxID=2593676 RepID=UPI00367ADD13
MSFFARASWPGDHRDEVVAGALAAAVIVVLGYAPESPSPNPSPAPSESCDDGQVRLVQPLLSGANDAATGLLDAASRLQHPGDGVRTETEDLAVDLHITPWLP